jgi:hypothetical protein
VEQGSQLQMILAQAALVPVFLYDWRTFDH